MTLYTTEQGGKIAVINADGELNQGSAPLPAYWTSFFKVEIETELSVKVDDEYEIIDMSAGDKIPADLWPQFETIDFE